VYTIVIAARASRQTLRETLLISVPFKLLAMIVQVRSGEQWVNVGLSEGFTGLVNGVVALLM
jgi:hypothetical protein